MRLLGAEQRIDCIPKDTKSRRAPVPSEYESSHQPLIKKMFFGDSAPNNQVSEEKLRNYGSLRRRVGPEEGKVLCT